MSQRRMAARVPTARVVGVARLCGHQLRFHKRGRDGSAKCNVLDTDNESHNVLGVLYAIDYEYKSSLDRIEGLGNGYEEKQIVVQTLRGEALPATTYFASQIDCSLKPFHWYREHVLIGAKENGFPTDYISTIESVEVVADKDMERARLELIIYD